MPQFRPGTPDYCPGDGAKETTAVLFRACDSDPPTAEDFTSHAHSTKPGKRQKADPKLCISWGLSVWVSEEDVKHALALHRWLKRKRIFKGKIDPPDGQLAQTGTPPHHTFWPYMGLN